MNCYQAHNVMGGSKGIWLTEDCEFYDSGSTPLAFELPNEMNVLVDFLVTDSSLISLLKLFATFKYSEQIT